MKIRNVNDLFLHELEKAYGSEKLAADIIPTWTETGSVAPGSKQLVDHFVRTRERILRIERVFKLIGQSPRAAPSQAAEAIVAETKATLDMIDDLATRSAARLAAMQALKYALAARYLTLASWSDVLRRPDLGGLLKAFVVEESDVPGQTVASATLDGTQSKHASMGDRLTDLFDRKK